MKKIKLTTKSNKYGIKDQVKSDKATQFIGIGSPKSSTHQYMKDWGKKANTGKYSKKDIVFVSINGARYDAVHIIAIIPLLDLAIKAGVTFITDDESNRGRAYNLGEEHVARYLKENRYKEVQAGVWKKIQPLTVTLE